MRILKIELRPEMFDMCRAYTWLVDEDSGQRWAQPTPTALTMTSIVDLPEETQAAIVGVIETKARQLLLSAIGPAVYTRKETR